MNTCLNPNMEGNDGSSYEFAPKYPAFWKHAYCVYKILTSQSYIEVCLPDEPYNKKTSVQHDTCPQIVTLVLSEGVRTTENEFIDCYVKAVHSLNMMLDEPTRQREEINNSLKEQYTYLQNAG